MRKDRLKILWFLLLCSALSGYGLSAQNRKEAAPASPGEYLTVKVAVMGPGDELYFWWGHIGLVIEDRLANQSLFYDYGVFSFENENFYRNFAFGRLLYSCQVTPMEFNLWDYVATNRDVTFYTLNLSAEAKERVRDFAEWNVLPENRDYYYHHFKDNCSTRIRDILDMATDGQFKDRYGDAPGRYTLRQHVRRHTWFSPFADWLLNFLMGQDIDTPITVWEEMFLPSEVGLRIQEFSFRDSLGIETPLVSTVEVVNRSEGRPAVLDIPPYPWGRALAVGLAAALILLLLFRWMRKRPFAQILLGLFSSLLALFFGLAGSALFFMTFFTNHDYTYHNSNVIFVNPLFLAAVPLGIRFALSRNLRQRFSRELALRLFWFMILFCLLLSMALKNLPSFYQQNRLTEFLILPIALVLSLEPRGLWEHIRRVFWRLC